VGDPTGTNVVGTAMTPPELEPVRAAPHEPGLGVGRVGPTGSSVQPGGGTGRFNLAAVYGSPQASVHLDQPPNTASWRALFPDEADAFDEVVTRPVSHVVASDVPLTDAVAVLATRGQMAGNLVAPAPAAGLPCAGAT